MEGYFFNNALRQCSDQMRLSSVAVFVFRQIWSLCTVYSHTIEENNIDEFIIMKNINNYKINISTEY